MTDTHPKNVLLKRLGMASMVAVLLATTALPSDVFAHGTHDEEVAATGQALVEEDTSWLDELLAELLLGSVEAAANISISSNGAVRTIVADGLPDHAPGQFPNTNNPNSISTQSYRFDMPTNPSTGGSPTSGDRYVFGVALNGVIFDPATAEFWNNDRSSGWNYEAFGPQTRSLGLDSNNAHVQPNGAYHYHGIPDGLYDRLASAGAPTLIGYAADGFPIYGPLGYADSDDPLSGLEEMTSSYALRPGTRSSGPGGAYDGTFTADWEYVPGTGTLDACNGRIGVTPEYPEGTYHYVITDAFPFVPRCFAGTPDDSFSKQNARSGSAQQPRRRPDGEGGGLRRPPREHPPIR
ncbi:MAG: YHYH protein [Pseudomonadota bacterium]